MSRSVVIFSGFCMLLHMLCDWFVWSHNFRTEYALDLIKNNLPPKGSILNFLVTIVRVIRDWIGFAFLYSVIGPENSRRFLNQSDAQLTSIATWSPTFSRVLCDLLVFTLSSHWLALFLTCDWPLKLLWFWFYDTPSKRAPYHYMKNNSLLEFFGLL